MSGYFKVEDEMDYRRLLLRSAAQGDARARKELEREYHAHVYSIAQLARYSPKIQLDRHSGSIERTCDALLNRENESESGTMAEFDS